MFISQSPADTETFGEGWARKAEQGTVMAVSGELGAGKTCLVRGIARGLGITSRVHSPTFTLLNVYSGGRLPLYHLDLYRLQSVEQILQAGLEEYLHSDGVTVIEWAEKWFGRATSGEPAVPFLQPSKLIHVHIEPQGETERQISYDDIGA